MSLIDDPGQTPATPGQTPATPGQTPATPGQTPATPGNQYAWFWSEGHQGEGEPPEWFRGDKYKSVAEQAKGYTNLEKRFGGFKGAPENYSLELPDGYETPEGVSISIDENDPLAKEFIAWGKENNVSQEAFSQILKMYTEDQVRHYQAQTETVQNQIKLLGDNARTRIDNVAKWGRANMDDEMFAKFRDSLTTAASVEMAEFLIDKIRNTPMPDPANINPNLMATKQSELNELRAQKGADGKLLWLTDPNHRAKIEALQKEVYGTGEYRQVIG